MILKPLSSWHNSHSGGSCGFCVNEEWKADCQSIWGSESSDSDELLKKKKKVILFSENLQSLGKLREKITFHVASSNSYEFLPRVTVKKFHRKLRYNVTERVDQTDYAIFPQSSW